MTLTPGALATQRPRKRRVAPIVLAAVMALVVVGTLVLKFVVPAVAPSLPQNALLAEAEAVAEATDGLDLTVHDDEHGYRVHFRIDSEPGRDYVERTAVLTSELTVQNWKVLEHEPLMDAELNSYRTKEIRWGRGYVKAVTPVRPVGPDDPVETVSTSVTFSLEP